MFVIEVAKHCISFISRSLQIEQSTSIPDHLCLEQLFANKNFQEVRHSQIKRLRVFHSWHKYLHFQKKLQKSMDSPLFYSSSWVDHITCECSLCASDKWYSRRSVLCHASVILAYLCWWTHDGMFWVSSFRVDNWLELCDKLWQFIIYLCVSEREKEGECERAGFTGLDGGRVSCKNTKATLILKMEFRLRHSSLFYGLNQ